MDQGPQFTQPSLFEDSHPVDDRPAPMCGECQEYMKPGNPKPRLRQGQKPLWQWKCSNHAPVWYPWRHPKD